MAQLVKSLPCKHEGLGLIPRTNTKSQDGTCTGATELEDPWGLLATLA